MGCVFVCGLVARQGRKLNVHPDFNIFMIADQKEETEGESERKHLAIFFFAQLPIMRPTKTNQNVFACGENERQRISSQPTACGFRFLATGAFSLSTSRRTNIHSTARVLVLFDERFELGSCAGTFVRICITLQCLRSLRSCRATRISFDWLSRVHKLLAENRVRI